jgi:hypothetical protein
LDKLIRNEHLRKLLPVDGIIGRRETPVRVSITKTGVDVPLTDFQHTLAHSLITMQGTRVTRAESV